MELSDIYDNKPTELCRLGYKYGTDKCPQIKHAYTPFYYKLFYDKRLSIKKVLEFGIGRTHRNRHQPEIVYELGVIPYLSRGASLYMWRDFFPNAQVFGADINPETIFEDERIRTYFCDERKEENIVKLIETIGYDINIVIDDASHHMADQAFLARTLLPLLNKDVTYIIEDVGHSRYITKTLNEYGSYDYDIPKIYRKWRGGMILVIKKKGQEIKSKTPANPLEFVFNKYQIKFDDKTSTPIEISNVGRDDLALLFNALGFKIGVEVGVERGYYSEILCKANPKAIVYGVDPWESLDICKNNPLERRTQNHRTQRGCDRIFEEAKLRLSHYPNHIIIRKYGIDAVNDFADSSLDFVYIDANHEYSCVMSDIDIWSKKVRPGGVVSGHDYYDSAQDTQDNTRHVLVKKVVDSWVAKQNIKPLIIWGARDDVSGVKRDKWRSWMFVNPHT